MKKETANKKKWLLPVILAAVLLLIAGGVAAFFLLTPQEQPQEGEQAVTSELYWNLDVEDFLDPETGLSVREPNGDGKYMIRFLVDGEIKELEISDKQLVNYIDSLSVMGLVFDESGVVVDVVEAKEVATEIAKEFFVMKHEPGLLTINSSIAGNGVNRQLVLDANTGIYDVSPNAKEKGAVTTQLNVLDEVTVYGREDGTISHVFVTERGEEAGVYLRVKQMYSSADGGTTRVTDETGAYTIEFAHKGEIVSLKCKDKKIVNAIDKASAPQHIMGLMFDEEGYITKTVTTNQAIRGKLLADNYTITAINGNVLELEKKLYNAKDVGKTVTATLSENCEIYYAEDECEAAYMGQKADGLQVGDRVFCYSNMDNEAVLIYISRRMKDYPIYYNVGRKYDSTKGETTREKENGYYVFEMIGEGKTHTLKTKDKALASKIDSVSTYAVGLLRDGNIIVDVCDLNCIVGNRKPGEGRFVTTNASGIVRIVSSSNFTSGGNYVIGANAQILDMTGNYGVKPGSQIKELRDGDRMSFWIGVDGNIGAAMVTQRYYSNTKLYYNYTRTYNATIKQTKRTPDAEGYYVYPMICEGKEVTVKTKSLEMASFIDKESSRFVALQVSKDGIIKNAYKSVSAIQYGRRTLNSVYYDGMTPDGKVKYYYFSEGKRLEGTSSQTLASGCKIYNYSEIYADHRGEKTKLQKGDQIQCFARYDSKEIVQIFVKAREFDSKLYYPVSQQYSSSKQETKRLPAEDGYYYVELAVDGEVKTFKTKDKNVMSKVDANSNAFGMKVNGDIIEMAFPAASIRGISGTSGSYYDAMKITGSTMSVTRNRPGSASTGKTIENQLNKGYKVYDVSPTAEKFGAPAQVGLGDRIISYINDDSKVVTIFIVNKHTREAGYVSYCEHCGKEVFWEHFIGTIYADNAHYYLPYTKETAYSQKTIGYSADQLAADPTLQQYEIVFDLNGHTYKAKTRMALIYSTLTIMDSVGGGKIIGGPGTHNGGVFMLSGATKSQLNIYSGDITAELSEEGFSNGGLVYNNKGTVNIYGGTLSGSKSTYGGAIYTSGGVVNMYGGTISGNSATQGGNLWNSGDALLNIYGGVVENGQSPQGENIYITASAKAEGATLNVKNAKILNGNVAFGNPKAINTGVLVADSTVDQLTVSDTLIKLEGKISGNIDLSSNARLDASALDTTSRIGIYADGIFTTELVNIADYLDCFQPAVAGLEIRQVGNALSCTMGELSVTEDLSFSGKNAICPVCKKLVAWTPLTQEAYGETALGIIATGGVHYYLAEDITYSGADTFVTAPGSGKTACFHLNGFNLTCTQARAFGGYPGVLNVMGTGIVSGNYQNAESPTYASTIHINTNKPTGAIVLWSGVYTQPESNTQQTVTGSPVNGGQILVHKDATIRAVASPYVFHGGNSKATNTRFAVLGGTVEGGIYMANRNTAYEFTTTLEIENGTVTGDIIVGKIDSVTLSGNAQLGGVLDLTAGTKLTLGELTMETPVSVKANGVFTEPTDKAEQYKAFFVAASGYRPVEVKDNALFTQEKPTATFTDNLELTGDQAYCPVCEKVVTWTALTQAEYAEKAFGTAVDGGHYYLAEDINTTPGSSFLTGPARKSGVPYVACFHLNGHNITNNSGAVISGNTGILNVMGSGVVAGNRVNSNEEYAATVQMNTTVTTGVINLYSGTYVKPAGNDQKSVVSVNHNGGTINIFEDVTIQTAAGENAVYIGISKSNHSYVNIYGGNLQGNVVASDRNGTDYETHLTISGGTITGDVIVGKISSVTLSGAPTIGGTLDLCSGMKLTLGDLANTTPIQVKAEGIFTQPTEQAAELVSKFAPATGYLPITVQENALYTGNFNNLSNNNLVFAENTTDASCPMCGKTVTWTPITGEATSVKLSKGGHYYLPADVSVNAADNGKDAYLYASLSGGTACLHLNGHNLTVTGHRAIISGMGVLNIMGNGVVSGERNTVSGATIHVNTSDAGATVNLLGGTYTKSENDTIASVVYIGKHGGTVNMYKDATIVGNSQVTAENAGCVRLEGSEGKNAVFNMYGGVIKNGKSNAMGGNVIVTTAYATFVLHDGEITGGSAASGGNIGLDEGANLQILGGKVQNGTATTYGGNICAIASAPVYIENALISGGTSTSHGGNIASTADLYLYDTVVTGGTVQSDKNGGNIYVAGTKTELLNLVIERCTIGKTENIGTGEAFEKGGIAYSGGNLYTNYMNVTVTDTIFAGGKATSHGGNVIINRGNLTINGNTQLLGGETTSQGGALRVYEGTVIMNDGLIKGGVAKKYSEYSNANVSLSTDCVMYMLGGRIEANENADRRGTGIDVSGTATVYLGGNATVTHTGTNAPINSREGSKIFICDGWSGSATIYLSKLYGSSETVAADALKVVTLDKDLNATAGGAFTGTLTQQDGTALTVQPDGTFKVN